MTLKKLRDLDFELWRALTKLYIDDPLQHFYLIYDLTYQLDRIDVLFDVEDRRVRSYLLVWLGTPFASFMVWGFSEEVVEAAVEGAAKCGMPCIVQVQLGEPLTLALDLLKRRGLKFNVKRYLDMAVDGESFKPYSPERAIPLNPRDHSRSFVELMRAQDEGFSEEEAFKRLSERRYYGVFEGERLVSVAGCYVALRDVRAIGGVYTHPSFRRRGYGKIVVSAVTKEAVESGAKAVLHVEEGNNSAIGLYEKLGYEVINARAWIFVEQEGRPTSPR